ncbi:Na+/H+ antiporter subunit A [Streptomyces sp. DSM 44917]|uniref:Na+/H+ antiporter subunit A n=1 Tax=Streptomyces boetiae TaxID=3075541 RepID=A0ABU2L961_9ACTN|nr:Na+/H+ antiporter subunit A [Streptomyces sp. DSM 44917]MDT0308094.1 Na+/H+ antiporter subunit A [Streptomyces sp. DSM 44917]
MLVLVAVHLGTAALLPPLAPRLGRWVWALAAAPPLAACCWALAHAGRVLGGDRRPVTESLPWAPDLGLRLDLRLDGLALLMVLVVSGVGVLVLSYAARYYERRAAGREGAWLLAFSGVMLGLVLADNLFLLYAFWELTTVVSFLLIAGPHPGAGRRKAAEQALLTTVAGGLALLLGLVALGQAAGTYRLSAILADPPTGGLVPAALVLILAGAFTKSAQLPFHSWLPAAMVAPTPISAYLHAAAMVKAGVYLVARLAPGFADAPGWRPLVLTVGLASFLVGAWRALRETDLKRVLAYGTISELGLLIALFGAGSATSALAGEAMLLAHALFKSALFLLTGVVERAAGTRDLRELSGLRASLPGALAVAVPAVASMAHVPPFLGWAGEDAVLEAFLHGRVPGEGWVLGGLAVGSVLTVALAARWLWGAFGTRPDVPETRVARPDRGLLVPAAVCAALSTALGLAPVAAGALATPYAELYPHPEYHLALWHGLTPATLLSLASLALGAALFAARGHVLALQGRLRTSLPGPPDAQRVYRGTIRGLGTLSVRVTRATQAGSLPVYLTVVLATVVLCTGAALLSGSTEAGKVEPWRSPAELVPAALVITAAVTVTALRHRLAAVLLTGAVGYGVAALFVARGAPDLALTQFLVEGLTLVVMVLVLRRLPARFTPEADPDRPPARAGAALRGAVSLGAGLLVAFFALAATHARDPSAAPPDYARGLPEAGGGSAVHAILVDFRALDTLGEIAVLLVTSIGVVSLIRVWAGETPEPSRTAPDSGPARPPRPPGGAAAERSPSAAWDEPRRRWLPGAGERPGTERSVLLEVVTRALFCSVLVLSLYLLLAGHDGPGGGFSGGLVAGQAFVLRYLVGGRTDLGLAAPADPGWIAGGGLVLAAVTGLVPVLFGHPPLAATVLEHPHVSTSLIFDTGVYLLVTGVILKLLHAAEGAR